MYLFILAGALLLAALVLALVSRWQRKSAGLPLGRVTYADPSLWGKVEKPLYDPATGLVGKPDYLVETKEGIIPVEVKSGAAPSNPYEGHVLQLAAYCLLVSRTTGKRPPYGLLNYRNRTFSIDFTPALEQKLLEQITAIQAAGRKKDVPRSHESPAKCASCGYKKICDQKCE
jgi:CRISPR-associated exonuclease Cas4